ncbi:MAG: hypothetical protein HQK51_05005 [Oligoflexia bacterium]|nr:hypothetical protein [Oligoflexia bacterium]
MKNNDFTIYKNTFGTFGLPKNRFKSYCLLLPGFGGDAFSREDFFKKANVLGIGIIPINVAIDESIEKILENNRGMQIFLKAIDESIHSKIKYISANSFGCYLSMSWIKSNNNSLEKVVFITPCSLEQLISIFPQYKGSENSVSALNENEKEKANSTVPLKLFTLQHDHLVTYIDKYFLNSFSNIEEEIVNYSNHYEIIDQEKTTNKILSEFYHE